MRASHETAGNIRRARAYRASEEILSPDVLRAASVPHRRLILGDPKDVPLQGAPTAFVSLREEGEKTKNAVRNRGRQRLAKNAGHPLKWGRDESPDCSPQHV